MYNLWRSQYCKSERGSSKWNWRLIASCVCRTILGDGPPGNWHTDSVPTGARANACWQPWALLGSFQVSSTIEYLTMDIIGEGVFVKRIASKNFFTTSKAAFWCRGTFWQPQAMGCRTFRSQLDLGSGGAWLGGAQSDSDNLLRRVDFSYLSSDGAIPTAGFRECGSGGHAKNYQRCSVSLAVKLM